MPGQCVYEFVPTGHLGRTDLGDMLPSSMCYYPPHMFDAYIERSSNASKRFVVRREQFAHFLNLRYCQLAAMVFFTKWPSALLDCVIYVYQVSSDKQMLRANANRIVTMVAGKFALSEKPFDLQLQRITMGRIPNTVSVKRAVPETAIVGTGPNPTLSEIMAMGWNRAVAIYFFPKIIVVVNALVSNVAILGAKHATRTWAIPKCCAASFTHAGSISRWSSHAIILLGIRSYGHEF